MSAARRWLLALGLVALLALGFAGWLSPDMRLVWASAAAWCGF